MTIWHKRAGELSYAWCGVKLKDDDKDVYWWKMVTCPHCQGCRLKGKSPAVKKRESLIKKTVFVVTPKPKKTTLPDMEKLKKFFK